MKQPWYFPVLDFVAFIGRVIVIVGGIVIITCRVVR